MRRLMALFFVLILLISFTSAFSFSEFFNKLTGRAVISCTDSDNGINYNVYGTTCVGSNCYNDFCYNATQLTETYCKSTTSISFTSYNCLCSNGKCTGPLTTTTPSGSTPSTTTTVPAPTQSVSPGTTTPTPSTTSSWLYDINCEYGNLNGKCSLMQPSYCNNGNLNDKCSLCGCPFGESCQIDETCLIIPATTRSIPSPQRSVSSGETPVCARTDTSCGTIPCEDCTATKQYYCKSGTQERWYTAKKCINNQCVWSGTANPETTNPSSGQNLFFHWETLPNYRSLTENQKREIENTIIQAALLYNSREYIDTPIDFLNGNYRIDVYFNNQGQHDASTFFSNSYDHNELSLAFDPIIITGDEIPSYNREKTISNLAFHEFSHAKDMTEGKFDMFLEAERECLGMTPEECERIKSNLVDENRVILDRSEGDAYSRSMKHLTNILTPEELEDSFFKEMIETTLFRLEVYTGEWTLCGNPETGSVYCSKGCGNNEILERYFTEARCEEANPYTTTTITTACTTSCSSPSDECIGSVVGGEPDGCEGTCPTIIGIKDCSSTGTTSGGGGGLELTPNLILGYVIEEGQFSENCGSTPVPEYQCSGNMRQKRTHNGKGCDGNTGNCFDADWGSYVNNNDCGSTPANRCVPIDKVQTHNGKGCNSTTNTCYDNRWNDATACTNICVSGACTARADGTGCIRKRECASNVCKLFKCGLRQNTEGCALNSDCASGFCYEFVCGDKRTTGQTCWSNGNCVSNKCRGFLPARCRA